MTSHPAEPTTKANPENTMKANIHTAEKLTKGNADAMSESVKAANPAYMELAKAYQELASRNAQQLTAAISSMSAIKQPGEFMALQQRLIKEGVESAVKDAQHIAELTAAVFTAAFAPVRKQIETAQKSVQH